MHAYDVHVLLYFIRPSGIMQFQEVCYTVVSYAPYTFSKLYYNEPCTFRVTMIDFFHAGPQSF